MSKYKNLYIIGSSHIAKESVNKVKEEIEKSHPEIICLELDQQRFLFLLSKKRKSGIKSLKSLGIKGFLFNFIGALIEKSLGKYTGIEPGSEMKTAIELASKRKIKLVLIDQPINITLKKLTSEITKKEKLRFVLDLLVAPFSRNKKLGFSLNKVPSKKIISKLIEEVERKYPTVYRVLVKERNIYMAKRLNKLMRLYPDKKILAIVGASHEEGIIEELKWMKN